MAHWSAAVSWRTKLTRLARYPSKLKTVVGDPRTRAGSFYGALGDLASRYDSARTLTGYEFRVFSQNGEDGIIAEIVRRIGSDLPQTFVEFGAGNGLAGNTLTLADVLGWQGLFIEAADDDFLRLNRKYQANHQVNTIKSFVTPSNIDDLLSRAGFDEIGVCSIDIDGNDFYVWKEMTAKPIVVVIEYNGALPPDEDLVQPLSDVPWDGTDYYGASLAALETLARRLGYVLVHTELTGTNAFFVRQEHAGCFIDIEPPRRVSNYELLWQAHPPDTSGRRYARPSWNSVQGEQH